jgi:hypothetical protein
LCAQTTPNHAHKQTRGYFADEEKTAEAFKGLIKGEEDSGHVYLQVRTSVALCALN